MNEIANLCELLGADVDMVRRGIGTDTRIGKRFLFAGIGYGGSCFPKDVQAMIKSAEEVNYEFDILNAVTRVNADQKTKLISHLVSHFEDGIQGKTIAIWGLAFKPYTDDIREAPALENITFLLEKGAYIRAYDPEAMSNVKKVFDDKIYFAKDEYDAADKADALMIMTEWPTFRTPDFEKLSNKLNNKLILDGRNLYDPKVIGRHGFDYYSVGRRLIKQ